MTEASARGPNNPGAAGPRADGARGISSAAFDRLAVTALGVVAVVICLTFRDYGLGWDDYTHAQYGDLLLALYGSGFADQRAFRFVNLYMYGGGFDMAAALAAKFLPFDLFETRRLMGGAVGLFGLFVTWRIGRRIGGPAAGLIALLLLTLCPLYYGHMFMNAKDAPFAAAMALVLLGLVRAFEQYPRPSVATILLFGAGLGLTIGSRIVGGIAVFYAAIPALLIVAEETADAGWRKARRRIGRFVVLLVPGLLLAYAVMGLVWPWGVAAPLNPLRALLYFSEFFEKPWKELFAGSLVPVPDMPRSYVPVQFAVRMPEIFLLLGSAGIVAATASAAWRRLELPRRAGLLTLVVAAVLPIALAVVMRPPMYNGIRHFVFVTPPLAALGGFAGARFLAWLHRHGAWAFRAGVAFFILGFAEPIYEFVRLHPYQYTHFNVVSGGVRRAHVNYMLDYWGLSLKQAADELLAYIAKRQDAPAGRSHWVVAVCGPHPAAEVELGPQFVTTWNARGADFAMMLGEFYCAELDAPVVATIEREGVVYARVYDIRGKSVPTLFTIAPVQ